MSGPDFTEILQGATLGEIEKPKPLPVGSYVAKIIGSSYDKAKNENKTPFVRFNLEVVNALSDVDEGDLEAFGEIAGKKTKVDLYLTDAALHMLQDFLLVHVGLEAEGMSLEIAIPEAQNNLVGIYIEHEVSKQDNETIFARVGRTFNPDDVE